MNAQGVDECMINVHYYDDDDARIEWVRER